MEALIITAILGIAISWYLYNKKEMQREANDKYVKRLIKESVQQGYDIWDDRLEGHVEDLEKKRRQANSKMLKDANNHSLEELKAECNIGDVDIWNNRLEGLLDTEEKKTRQKSTNIHRADEIRNCIKRSQTEALLMNKDYDSYHQAALTLDVEILDYEALRGCRVDEDGVKLSDSFLGESTDILSFKASSFCQNHELTIKIINFLRVIQNSSKILLMPLIWH